MSYAAESAELARALARLLLTPPPGAVTATELQLTAAYRADVLNSLTGLHRALFPGATGANGRTGVADLEANPLDTLGALLARYPRGPASPLAPTERAEAAPASDLGMAWRAAARHALLAGAAAARLPDLWAEGEAAWGVVADLAAEAEAFAVAHGDLERLAAACPGSDLPSASPGLRLAAAECGRIARAGPLAPLRQDEAPAAAARRVVADPADLPDAQRRVVALLTKPPAPPVLAQIAVGQARAHLAAARVLRVAANARPERAPALRAVASALGERAGGLADIAAACDRLSSLHRTSGMPAVQQTGEIMRHLQRLADRVTPADAVAAVPATLAFARAGTELIATLDDAVRRGVAAGHYLVPNTNDHIQARWVPAHLLSAPPALLDATARAVAHEPGIRAALPPPQSPTVDARAAQAAAELHGALAARAPARPPRPSGLAPPSSVRARAPARNR